MFSGLLLCGTLALASAQVDATQFIQFGLPSAGTGWDVVGLSPVGSADETVTFTDASSSSLGEIVFSLRIEGSNILKSGPDNIKIHGGAMNERIDSGALGNPDDDEWIRFSLSVSGPGAAHLKSVDLNSIRLTQIGQDATVVFSDGTREVTVAGFGSPADNNYDTSLAGLARLKKGNVGGVGDGSWQIELKAVDHSPETQTHFRLGIVSISYEVGVPRISESLGFAHAGAKYTLLEGVDGLNEGAVRIEELGGSMMKIFMSRGYGEDYLYNTWPVPAPKSLLELAQTAPFVALFERPGIQTYQIVATSFAVSSFGASRTANWRDGLTSAEAGIVYKEIYDLVYHLRQNYDGKTFIIQNWEGDNQFRSVPDADIAVGTQGMIDWLVIRGQAVADAKGATASSKSEVFYAMEVNWLPVLDPDPDKAHLILDPNKRHYIIDTVIPYTEAAQADFVSLSSWATGTNDPQEHLIGRALDYMQSRLPANFDKSKKNIIIGEFGARETLLRYPVLDDDLAYVIKPDGSYLKGDFSDPAERRIAYRQVVGRQLEQFLHWGAPFIAQWSVYDNEFRVFQENDTRWQFPVANDDLRGHYIFRPDGSETLVVELFKAVLGEDPAEYRNVFEIENQRLISKSSEIIDVPEVGASGGAYHHIVAPAIRTDTVYELFVQQPGTYQIEVGFKTGPDAGAFHIRRGNVVIGTYVDTYAVEPAFSSAVLAGTLTLTPADVETAQRLTVRYVGKNAASTGTDLRLDYLKLIPQTSGDSGTGTDTGNDTGNDTGTDTDTGNDSGNDTDTGDGTDTGSGTDFGNDTDTGTGDGTGTGTDTGDGTGTGTDPDQSAYFEALMTYDRSGSTADDDDFWPAPEFTGAMLNEQFKDENGKIIGYGEDNHRFVRNKAIETAVLAATGLVVEVFDPKLPDPLNLDADPEGLKPPALLLFHGVGGGVSNLRAEGISQCPEARVFAIRGAFRDYRTAEGNGRNWVPDPYDGAHPETNVDDGHPPNDWRKGPGQPFYDLTIEKIRLLILFIETIEIDGIDYGCDKDRVFLMGFSAGSQASWYFVRQFGDMVAGFVTIGGSVPLGVTRSTNYVYRTAFPQTLSTLPMLEIIGTRDNTFHDPKDPKKNPQKDQSAYTATETFGMTNYFRVVVSGGGHDKDAMWNLRRAFFKQLVNKTPREHVLSALDLTADEPWRQ